MVDQPDNQPKPSDADSAPQDAQSPQSAELWHEPPVEEGSSRPVLVEKWFLPEDAIIAETLPEPATSETIDALPDTTPEQDGAWFTPLDAQLDAFLSGADATIVEISAPDPSSSQPIPVASLEPEKPLAPSAEPVASEKIAETRIDSPTPIAAPTVGESPSTPLQEPGVAAESTPMPDATSLQTAAPVPSPDAPDTLALNERHTAASLSLTEQQETIAPETNIAESDSSPFEQVEQKIAILRSRYQAGALTREQLQAELRSLMILDGEGRWWMLGLDSNRWYYYDGRDWTQAMPPGYDERVKGSPVRTETGVQEVVVDIAAEPVQAAIEHPRIEIDDDGMPLPRRVPQEDPGATLVSPSTPFMEPMRPSEAPTLTRTPQVEPGAESAGYVARPEPTISSIPVAPQAASTPPQKPKPRLGEFSQPDYSAALGPSHNRNTYMRWGIRFAVFAILGSMFLTLVVLLGMIGYYLYQVNQYSDAVASLQERAANFETTLILDANGTTLAEFSNFESPNTGTRKEIPLNQISPWLIHATIATENETFYTDPGFSVLAIVRAAYQNVRAGGTVSGASTITQQLARALVLETEFASERTTGRKIVEIVAASEIKRKYSKNEILEIYLNEIFYGNFAYGTEAAAQTYFNKSASELNPAEAAFLAGLPQSPATYDPVVNREAAITRMHTVLRLMAEANGTGCINIQHEDTTRWGVSNNEALCIFTETQLDGSVLYYYQGPNMAAPQEMVLDIARVETAAFKTPEFRAEHPHFVNYVWQQLEDTYGPQRIYSAGFRVWTTLDPQIQTAAEQSVTNHLANLQARGIDASNASVVVIRPSDGAVLAMVGSADYYNEDIDGQVNIAFTAQQSGSAIKPFVYLSAFEPDAAGRYLTPASVLWDVDSNFNGYIPTNYDQRYHGPQTVRNALGNSYNIPAVKALEFVGVERFTEFAERVGLTFPLGNPVERQAGLTTALGAVEVRLFDMVAGYAMLANNGRRIEPYAIAYIQDSKDNEIHQADLNPAGLQVVQPEYTFLLTNILSDEAARSAAFGSGLPMELPSGRDAAVKTGTSNDSRDVWTLGYTPQMAVGVWVGNSDNRPMYGLTGYSGAAPIWNNVIEAAHVNLGVGQFAQPAGLIQVEVCNDSGVQPTPNCAGRTHWDIFANTAPPPPPDQDMFRTLQVDGYTGRLVNEFCPDDPITLSFLAIDDPAAIAWINNTPEGNAWASQRGLELPLNSPPTEYCDPNQPRPTVIVGFPPQDMIVEGVLPLRGTINMPNFSHYEIRYGASHDPQAFSEPLVVAQTQWPDPDSVLGQFDTRTQPNGPYTLRLVVTDIYGQTVARDIRITINNPQPAPVPVFSTPTLAPSVTPMPGQIIGPTPAPTLTPG